MKKGKRVLVGILGLALMASLVACGKGEKKEGALTIGIAQFAEHSSLDNCREGFIKGLAEAGFKEGENVSFIYENAGADGGVASQIADHFISKKMDMICTITTPMSQIVYSKAKDENIPIIYTAITNPMAAELAKEDGSPVGEITGTSDKLPVKEQLSMIRELLSTAKKIGILYSTSEVNSVVSVEEYKKIASEYGFEIVEQAVSSSADVPLAIDSLLGKVDCMNNITDNTVVNSLDILLSKAEKAGIPVFGSEIEQVKKGCVASMGLDYVALGVKTGKMAAEVLKGEKKASEIKFATIDEAKFYGNEKVAKKLGIAFPKEYLEQGELVE